jgi:hypothetical protein
MQFLPWFVPFSQVTFSLPYHQHVGPKCQPSLPRLVPPPFPAAFGHPRHLALSI